MGKTIDRDSVLAQITEAHKVELTKETFQILMDKLNAQEKRIKQLENQIIKLNNTAMVLGHY